MLEHEEGKQTPHPERPDRIRAIIARLMATGLAGTLVPAQPSVFYRESPAAVQALESQVAILVRTDINMHWGRVRTKTYMAMRLALSIFLRQALQDLMEASASRSRAVSLYMHWLNADSIVRIAERCRRIHCREATKAELATCHSREHIEAVAAKAEEAGVSGEEIGVPRVYYSQDTYVRPETFRCASLSAGGAIEAACTVARSVFCHYVLHCLCCFKWATLVTSQNIEDRHRLE